MLVPLFPENPTVLQSCITGQYTSVGAIGAEADVAVTLSSVSGAGQVEGAVGDDLLTRRHTSLPSWLASPTADRSLPASALSPVRRRTRCRYP